MKMHFLSLSKQIDQINRSKNLNNLTIRYFIGYIFLIGVFAIIKGTVAITADAQPFPLPFLIIGIVVGVGIALSILYNWYESNGGDKGREFLPKIFLLGWILWWRLVLIAVPVLLFIGFSVVREHHEMMRSAGILSILYCVGAVIYFIVAMSMALREIREYEVDHKRVRHNQSTVGEHFNP